ncbi:type II toxin-antitoxin system Phd/YefM family antitoxin [Variovorax terrae]|uniref:Antitoxin n=1 Tax=Variovorax terrae TaxID=2923278 RepID=A0A9X2AM04_9BURK|nr:type II toxin-antitoxin system prevent-host-death family antitoxin [Variovorax terrae]MCJ0763218.1 type II toxin-antitoxin system prevent-host-death family antitoxin [Variovorax terrae]
MQTVPINEAKTRLSALIHAVEQGEEVVLTRHGKKVIRLVAATDDEPTEAERDKLAAQALEDLRAFRSLWSPAPTGDGKSTWQQLRDEGRKY